MKKSNEYVYKINLNEEEYSSLVKNRKLKTLLGKENFTDENGNVSESIEAKLNAIIKFLISNNLFTNEEITTFLEKQKNFYTDDIKQELKEEIKTEIIKELKNEIRESIKENLRINIKSNSLNTEDFIKYASLMLRLNFDMYMLVKDNFVYRTKTTTPNRCNEIYNEAKKQSLIHLAKMYHNNKRTLNTIEFLSEKTSSLLDKIFND